MPRKKPLPTQIQEVVAEFEGALRGAVDGDASARGLVTDVADRAYDLLLLMEEHQRRAAETNESIDMNAVVGRRVAKLRRDAHWTQEQLAQAMQRLGFTSWKRVAVAEVETNNRKVSFDELLALAALFAVPVFNFLLPAPDETIKFPHDRALAPDDVVALVTGAGSANGQGGSSWEPALRVALTEPDSEEHPDKRPAAQLWERWPRNERVDEENT